MLNLIRADLYKLRKSLALKICFLVTCVSAGALTYISHAIATGSMSASVSGNASGLSDICMMALLGSLMTGVLVCSDFETNAIHDAVTCGSGRISVVVSKALVYLLLIAFLLLPYGVATVVGFCSGAEFTKPFVPTVFLGILANETGISLTAAAICKIILLSLIAMLVYAARLCFCLPLAFKLRKPVAIMAIGMATDFLVDLVIRLLNGVPVISNILSFTPYSKGLAYLTMGASVGTLLEVIVVNIVYFAVMTGITFLLFRRAEIK
jgi:ABC-2 type transport system permease protein